MNKTKKAIFDSALKIFSTNGYDGATMDDIAQFAGVAKGTLYYHFKSKEEIFGFIIKEGLESIRAKTIELIDQEEDSVSKIMTFCKSQLNLVEEHKDFLKVVMSQLWGASIRHNELRNSIVEYAKDIEKFVKSGIEDGVMKKGDPLLMTCSVLGTVCALALHRLIHDSIDDLDQEIEQMMDFLLLGINK